MESAGIAELKSRLSHYLRLVRHGRSVTILDRDRPVARLVPFAAETPLRTRPRAPDAVRPGSIPLPPPLDAAVDVDELLAEERTEG